MIKGISVFICQMIKLLVIGLPIAIVLYCSAHIFFELKRITKWIIN